MRRQAGVAASWASETGRHSTRAISPACGVKTAPHNHLTPHGRTRDAGGPGGGDGEHLRGGARFSPTPRAAAVPTRSLRRPVGSFSGPAALSPPGPGVGVPHGSRCSDADLVCRPRGKGDRRPQPRAAKHMGRCYARSASRVILMAGISRVLRAPPARRLVLHLVASGRAASAASKLSGSPQRPHTQRPRRLVEVAGRGRRRRRDRHDHAAAAGRYCTAGAATRCPHHHCRLAMLANARGARRRGSDDAASLRSFSGTPQAALQLLQGVRKSQVLAGKASQRQ